MKLPGISPEHNIGGTVIPDPLYGHQACFESNFFLKGVGKTFTWKGPFSCRPFLKRGKICSIPAPHMLNDSYRQEFGTLNAKRSFDNALAPQAQYIRTRGEGFTKIQSNMFAYLTQIF